jgi:hypothetical protein
MHFIILLLLNGRNQIKSSLWNTFYGAKLFSLQEMMIYLIGKLNQELVILTFGQFDHLVMLDKSI